MGDYKAGFRRNRSTIDQIFALRLMHEKCYEYNIDLHHLFIDFKQAYDSIYRSKMYETLQEFGIPDKLIRLVRMCLNNSAARVRVQGGFSDVFSISRGLRQGDVLSTILFNLTLERVIRSVDVNPNGTIFSRSMQYLAYADDVVLVCRTFRALEESYDQLEKGAKAVGLQLNYDKTKYMLSSRYDNRCGNRPSVVVS